MAEALIPRADLFGNPNRVSGTISPDGAYLGWVAPLDGVMNVWVAPTERPEEARAVTFDTGRGVRIHFWAYDGRNLLFLTDQDGDENWRLHATDPRRGESRALTPAGVRALVSGISRRRRDAVLVMLNERDPRFPDLFSVSVATGERTLVAENPGFSGFMADEDYVARLALRPRLDGGQDVLRAGGDGWEDWFEIAAEDSFVTHPDHLSADGSILYMHDSRARDTAALTSLDLATGETRVLAEHPHADIGGLLTDPQTHAPLAYAVTVERAVTVAIDARVQPDLDFLAAQDLGEWYVMSRTEDDRRWVVGANSDTRPGVAYLYDRDARSLRVLHETRPALAKARLAPMRAVTITARDGLRLVSYLTRPHEAPSDGALVLLVHGGPWGRDVFGYDAFHQWLADRGYAALSVNFRGSTGFGKAFVNAGDREWGRRMDDDLQDAVAWAVSEGFADPRRVAIMGGSYGGYAVLAAMTRSPRLYACGIDIVGPSNLQTLLATTPPYWAAFRSRLIRSLGDPATQDGRALLRERSPLHRAGEIERPLLIAQGANDPRVRQAESDQMVAAMQAKRVPVTYLLFPDEGHGLVRPENNLAFMAAAETFLSCCLGGRADPITAAERSATSMRVLQGASLIEGLDAS